MNLDELSAYTARGESLMIYGPPKSGKTLLAATLAEKYKLLWFDLEKGVQTLRAGFNSGLLKPEWKQNITAIQIPDTRTNPIAISTMLKVLSGNKNSICYKHGATNCLECKKTAAPMLDVELRNLDKNTIVVMDSLSQLSDSATAKVLGPDVDDKMEIQDFGATNQQIAMALSFIQNAPYSFVAIGHEVSPQAQIEVKGGPAKAPARASDKITPFAGTRNFSKNVARFFSSVIYAEHTPSGFKVYSDASQESKMQVGNRAGIKWEQGKTKLVDFFSV